MNIALIILNILDQMDEPVLEKYIQNVIHLKTKSESLPVKFNRDPWGDYYSSDVSDSLNFLVQIRAIETVKEYHENKWRYMINKRGKLILKNKYNN